MLVWFSKIRSCKRGCAPRRQPAAHFLCSTARIRQDISTASFCSCKLLWRSDECVLLPVLTRSPIFCSYELLCRGVEFIFVRYHNLERWYFIFSAMTYKIRGVVVEEYAYYVNKLRQNVGLETWMCCQIVTSQTAHTKSKWPPHATEWKKNPWKFSAYATGQAWALLVVKHKSRLKTGQRFGICSNYWNIAANFSLFLCFTAGRTWLKYCLSMFWRLRNRKMLRAWL